jgi:hypothetical protein
MKQALFLLLLFGSFAADAQSLKEALFSGKLKNDAGTVVRKGDDLSAHIDTTTRKEPARDTLAVITAAQMDSSTRGQATAKATKPATGAGAPNTPPAAGTTGNTTDNTAQAGNAAAVAPPVAAAENGAEAEATEPEEAAPAPVEKVRDNRGLFKDYMNGLVANLKSEVLSNKKIKKGTYYVTVAYTIETDGKVTLTELLVDPKNDFLQQQIRQMMEGDLPTLNPEVNSSGVARKVNRRYNFSLDKE